MLETSHLTTTLQTRGWVAALYLGVFRVGVLARSFSTYRLTILIQNTRIQLNHDHATGGFIYSKAGEDASPILPVFSPTVRATAFHHPIYVSLSSDYHGARHIQYDAA